MGDRLSEIEVFIETAERGSLTAAARALGISTTAASRRLAALEDRLGVRLLERTTRQMSLTEAGAAYLSESRHLLGALDALDEAIRAPADGSASTTVHAPPPLDLLLPALLAELPQLMIAVRPAASADVVLSIGPPSDKLRTLGPLRLGLFAAPSWITAHGAPQTPAELVQRPCLRGEETSWRLRAPTGALTELAVPPGRLDGASDAARLRAACAGLGAARLPLAVARASAADGRLVPLLPDFEVKSASWVRVAHAPGRGAQLAPRLLLGALAVWLGADL